MSGFLRIERLDGEKFLNGIGGSKNGRKKKSARK